MVMKVISERILKGTIECIVELESLNNEKTAVVKILDGEIQTMYVPLKDLPTGFRTKGSILRCVKRIYTNETIEYELALI